MLYALVCLISFIDAAPDAMPDAVIVPVSAIIADKAPIPDPQDSVAAVPANTSTPTSSKASVSGCANGRCPLPSAVKRTPPAAPVASAEQQAEPPKRFRWFRR